MSTTLRQRASGWVLRQADLPSHVCDRPQDTEGRPLSGKRGDVWLCGVCGQHWLIEIDDRAVWRPITRRAARRRVRRAERRARRDASYVASGAT